MKLLQNIATQSMIRVVLIVAIATLAAIKFEEGVKIGCAVAATLNVSVAQCEKYWLDKEPIDITGK